MNRPLLLSVFAFALGVTACGSTNDAPAVCSTNSAWLSGDEGSALMHPGGDCIDCHSSRGEGPHFAAAGTVMGASNDDENCNGVSGATIEIIGKDGSSVTLTSNSAGNFYSKSPIPTPFTAKVTYNGKTSQMQSEQTDGACNSCHTAAGANGAPGRIALPK